MRSLLTTAAEAAGLLVVAVGAGLRFGLWAGLVVGGAAAVAAGVAAG